MNVASELLLEASTRIGDAGCWLVLGGDPAVPVELALRYPGSVVRWVPLNVPDHDRVRRIVSGHPVENLEVWDDPATPVEPEDMFDAVVFETSLHRPLVRRWLAHARLVLADGGWVFLAGANDAGVRSAIGDAKRLFGHPVSDDYRRHHRVTGFQRSGDPDEAPYWLEHPGIAPRTWQSFQVDVRSQAFALDTLPGVFPGDRLDAGTALLLEHTTVPPGVRVLDAGCGTGIIGLLAARIGANHVDLIDVNLLAVAVASRNLGTNGITSGRVVASDIFSGLGDARYDLIVSNPPFHQGKAIDLSMPDRLISEAPGHLLPGGSLMIVANSFLRYERQMRRVFGHVETVVATRQYHVIAARDPR